MMYWMYSWWIVTLSWKQNNNHLLQIIAYHVDLTTLADGTYELIPEPDEGICEAQVHITKDLSEALNPGLEDTDITDPSLTSEGKPRCITQYFKLCTYTVIYLSCALSSRNCYETLVAWNLGTYVMFPSPYRVDALLIGPAEVEWFPVTRAI
jgi:hypothetical protein